TVSYAATGWAILLFRRQRSQGSKLLINGSRLARDQVAFLAIFVAKVGLGFVAFPGKPFTGLVFLTAYIVYFWRELRQESTDAESTLMPLRSRPNQADPRAVWVFLQTGLALVAVFVGSQVFVAQLEGLALGLGVPGHLVALVLSPVATELPETMNAIIWVRQGKERLALANISGAMMIQATVPSALGLFFTPWLFDTPLALAGAVTMLSIVFLIFTLRTNQLTAGRLSLVGLGYAAFAVLFIATR
ncbi:MAG: sodium:calcium antiporter, partial [Chloroflexota bacterium]|nr:sodium:calcium antiporter [Chloroflexota bacterium]